MKKVILTGFLPFGGYKFNPTEESTRYFDDIGVISNTRIIGLVLPCTYFGAFNILSEVIDKEKPNAVISTGLSSSVKRIRIETTFHNIMDGKYPDADGFSPKDLPLCNEYPLRQFLMGTANNIYLANLLHFNGIPVEVSIDADSFICNSLGYLTTKKILENHFSSIKNVFIHVPWTDNYKDKISLDPSKVFLEKNKYYRAIELLVRYI